MGKTITVLGCTGSIGVQSLDVARRLNYKVAAMAAGGANLSLFEQQIREFKPEIVAVFDKKAADDLKVAIADTPTTVVSGNEGVCEVAGFYKSDVVLNSIVGIAGLLPTLSAIEANKNIALANKETLVTGGSIVMNAARKHGVTIYPVDSEHSAIFQCLQGVPDHAVKGIILTASGGPFFNFKRSELKNVTPAQALKHPNWSMGRKITIDSATLMNKGLEVIEAVHLFGVSAADIDVVVHRQSIIHSAVELVDGGIIAQLGLPDMHLPIQYALTYPNRFKCEEKRLSLTEIGKLTFEKPDIKTFVCLKTCIDAITRGGLKPAAANGANEAAVALFLDGKIGFLDIGELVAQATENQKVCEGHSVDDILAADLSAREFVYSKAKLN
ncbi:MAG: 1-deoxy-D-xylulose-5-phosphate reductoisomerase [bacterium]|nr:1-deoxy-D-xylulose-5-phosphate reductoisomerase [bacterium]